MDGVLTAANRSGYPVVVRPSYTMGGAGVAIVRARPQFDETGPAAGLEQSLLGRFWSKRA